MITSSINTGKKSFYNMAEFLCDFESDVANLPINRGVGSKAFVIENGNVYVFNSYSQWVLQPKNSGGGGGITPDPGDTIIYDGGVIN